VKIAQRTIGGPGTVPKMTEVQAADGTVSKVAPTTNEEEGVRTTVTSVQIETTAEAANNSTKIGTALNATTPTLPGEPSAIAARLRSPKAVVAAAPNAEMTDKVGSNAEMTDKVGSNAEMSGGMEASETTDGMTGGMEASETTGGMEASEMTGGMTGATDGRKTEARTPTTGLALRATTQISPSETPAIGARHHDRVAAGATGEAETDPMTETKVSNGATTEGGATEGTGSETTAGVTAEMTDGVATVADDNKVGISTPTIGRVQPATTQISRSETHATDARLRGQEEVAAAAGRRETVAIDATTVPTTAVLGAPRETTTAAVATSGTTAVPPPMVRTDAPEANAKAMRTINPQGISAPLHQGNLTENVTNEVKPWLRSRITSTPWKLLKTVTVSKRRPKQEKRPNLTKTTSKRGPSMLKRVCPLLASHRP